MGWGGVGWGGVGWGGVGWGGEEREEKKKGEKLKPCWGFLPLVFNLHFLQGSRKSSGQASFRLEPLRIVAT